ncbi:hypothetical protein GCM10012285_60350 [Streptomyces kronopolitis]|uniref:Uncharacterized protein n=1 Tax=Streptomyces kronopolitis TaxID=1612435 RepID=A0ABQ2JYR8_9ACTN|nr:hypothetical protein [Streptomyces kronopolitis]GGN61444.1 hypothetical protein GCM10012285_60350 [Streptomyces kronopolitis]
MNTTPNTTPGIFRRLDAEWAELCADPGVRGAVYGWLMADCLAVEVAVVTDSWVRSLGPEQLLAALRPTGSATGDALTDAVLRALLDRAAGHGRSAILAARIVVQAMIPAAVRITHGQIRPFGGRTLDDVGHMTIAALFEIARSGKVLGRPGRPAANLALDALRRVLDDLAADREPRGSDLKAAEDLADPLDPFDPACACLLRCAATAAGLDETPAEEELTTARLQLLELVLDAMDDGTLSEADARVIAGHYRNTPAPLPDREAARAADTSVSTWQRRRSRAVARLKTATRSTAA